MSKPLSKYTDRELVAELVARHPVAESPNRTVLTSPRQSAVRIGPGQTALIVLEDGGIETLFPGDKSAQRKALHGEGERNAGTEHEAS